MKVSGSPLHRENRGNGKRKTCEGKHRDLGNVPNTGKTKRILFTQVVNSLILKVKKCAIFTT